MGRSVKKGPFVQPVLLKRVKEMNAAMQAVVEDPTVNEGIAGIGHIPGWHDLEESEELHQKEYDELVEIAKSLDMYVQG